MKKLLLSMFVSAMMIFVTVPAWSVPYVYTAPTDSIVAYGTWSPSDKSEMQVLATYLGLGDLSDSAKLAAFNALYGYTKDEAIGSNDYKDLATGFSPGFSWDYAIVKVGCDFSYLFMDDNASLSLLKGDDVLTTPIAGETLRGIYNQGHPPKGISHVSFFTSKTQVPEPATLLLFGLGLLGLAGVRRKLKK